VKNETAMCEITHRGLSYGNEYIRWRISRSAGDLYRISFFDISLKKSVFSDISIFSICNIAMIQKMLIKNTFR
jgi:hypothetical protein